MFQRVHKHINPPTGIALIALIFAVTGVSFAATGGGGNGGSNAHSLTASIAKKKKPTSTRGPAGPKGATGPAGPAGATGPAGPAGATGPAGTGAAGPTGPIGPQGPTGPEGAKGTAGTNGESVKNTPLGKNTACKEGGAEFKVGSGTPTYACNGEGGSGGGYPEFLPGGKTETGAWTSVNSEDNRAPESYENITISFSIPLKEPIAHGHAVFVSTEEQAKKSDSHCGGTAAEPTAEEGYLCVYQGITEPQNGFEEYESRGIQTVGYPGLSDATDKSGARMTLFYKGPAEPHEMLGSWAVTAEEA